MYFVQILLNFAMIILCDVLGCVRILNAVLALGIFFSAVAVVNSFCIAVTVPQILATCITDNARLKQLELLFCENEENEGQEFSERVHKLNVDEEMFDMGTQEILEL